MARKHIEDRAERDNAMPKVKINDTLSCIEVPDTTSRSDLETIGTKRALA